MIDLTYFYSSVTVLLYTVKEKGGKSDIKPYPLPSGLRNPYRKLKYENSQDYAQKAETSTKLYVQEFSFCKHNQPVTTIACTTQNKTRIRLSYSKKKKKH
jgi:hypothetical protein